VVVGWLLRESTATPATNGTAGLPLNVLIGVFDELQANMIYSPGANRSTQGPKLENDAR
jgi:hypothetical protein